jgi:8-oxo-dGTP pyrophosphatase MutT (NUDIX family)
LTGGDHPVILNCMKTGNANNPKIIPAATVILTRQRAGKLQVYLLKRSPQSEFMPGYFVFPGGTLDSQDRHFDLFSNHCDLTPGEISSRFGSDLSEVQALVYCVAAIRETFEEAGVCLFQRNNTPAVDLERVYRWRLSTGLEKDWLLKLVAKDGCRLSLSALSRWSHWITPELMKRRFDTRFFLADMPSNQFSRPDERETVQELWLSPREALTGNVTGKIPLSPPTLVTLHELLKYSELSNLQAQSQHRPWGQTRLPRLVPLPKGAVIVQPWDPKYDQKEINIDPASLPTSVLSVGESFSRLWCDHGIWKPIRM